MALSKKIFVIFYLITSVCYSQLAGFDLDVVVTDETCAGNGSLQMTVSNTTPGSEITYNLYLAPDFTNSIAETSTNSFGSLLSGDYLVIATQNLDGLSNTQQQEFTIQDLVVDLDFDISYTTVTDCDVTGTLTVNILSGNPITFEILSGPVTAPEQASNVFSGLSAGIYTIRVFDDCNNALSKVFTLFLQTNDLTISPGVLPIVYDSCSTVEVTNTIDPASGTEIIYPITITYTLHPPDGSPDQITTEFFTTGPPDGLELTHTIPLFGNQTFSYDILITDNCGNEFPLVNPIDPNPRIGFTVNDAPCSTAYFSISALNFSPPYDINFEDAPDEFIPENFNQEYPGPNTESVLEFGDEENPVPFGDYSVSMIDACGRTSTINFIVDEVEIEPDAEGSSSLCGAELGFIRASIPDDRIIVSATITVAPADFTEPLPHDVTEFVDDNGLLIAPNLQSGDYTIVLIDDCGIEYIVEEINVPEFSPSGLLAGTRPNCDPGTGSVRISSGNGDLVSLIMTDAPLTYLETLPYDVTFNINTNSGNFFMSDLPAGEYSFSGIDECGFESTTSIDVIGYNSNPSVSHFTVTRNCGSFNLEISDSDISVTNKSYWFQKFFPEQNSWGHPYTGVNYTEGTVPNTSNSISLDNNETVFNLFLMGDFRIIKVFESFNSGTGNSNCIDDFGQFTISDKLIINGAYSLDCNGGTGPSDIILDVVGVAAFSFSITSPFEFDNGNSNVFTGLAPGVYDFDVMDDCGNIKNIRAEVGNLVPLSRANTPESMLVCRNDTNQVGVFVLSDQNPQILGSQNPNDYNVTYHLNQSDANSGNAALDEAYTNISNPQTIYARVTHKILDVCYATTSFPIFIGNNPILTPTLPVFVCEGNTKTLFADPGFDAYEWTTGETTPSIVVTEPGTYGVTVKNVYQDFTCDSSQEFTVTGSSIATFVEVNTMDWSSGSNTITVFVSGTGDYVYSLDDINYQTENTFTDLVPGNYTVYVKDINGCGTINDAFSLLNYPNFFTPNGDGYNDTWNIRFASFEPNMSINVFDRYGKFIIQLFGDGPGWDGTYNGKPLPSTDYWFVVTREDGTIHKGHFAMKR